MDRIFPPIEQNYVMRAGDNDIKIKNFVSELGIYGTVIG